MRATCGSYCIVATLALTGIAGAGDELVVTSVEPAARSMGAPISTPITVHFDRPVNPATVDASSFWAFARWSGTVAGTFEFGPDNESVTLVPETPLSSGESVMVIVSHDVEAADGSPLRTEGYSWQFWTGAGVAGLVFEEVETIPTTMFPGEAVRTYGGIATDLDNDGWLDLTAVNEDSDDLRVFLNNADGSGSFGEMLQPTTPIGHRASPSEPSDFDRDGNADICVCNINDATVSILLGNGDGTFAPQQVVDVSFSPRGIAVLDVDGDGDTDIVNTNSSAIGGGNLSVLINDGAGVFGAPTFFDTPGTTEWSLGAADLNEDGILDLVVGARGSHQMITLLSNGDATFTLGTVQASGGSTWMLNCGDVNGDGHEDVASANSGSNNGAILLGDGLGGLAPPETVFTDPFPLATDLADLDGDGDLDWMTSSFGGDWRLYTNDGDGTFTFDQEFDAPAAASCSLPFDIDNDGDLDLALIDEVDDIIIVMRNTDASSSADLNGDGVVDGADLGILLGSWGPCDDCPADLNGDGNVDGADLGILLGAWTVPAS